MAARPAAGRTRGFVHFFPARSARHVLVDAGGNTVTPAPRLSLRAALGNRRKAPHSALPLLWRARGGTVSTSSRWVQGTGRRAQWQLRTQRPTQRQLRTQRRAQRQLRTQRPPVPDPSSGYVFYPPNLRAGAGPVGRELGKRWARLAGGPRRVNSDCRLAG